MGKEAKKFGQKKNRRCPENIGLGDDNFEALRKELFEQFGKAHESEGSMKRMDKRAERERSSADHAGAFYAWQGKNTEIWLSYSKDRHKGNLTMNSRKIREERRDYEKGKEKELTP